MTPMVLGAYAVETQGGVKRVLLLHRGEGRRFVLASQLFLRKLLFFIRDVLVPSPSRFKSDTWARPQFSSQSSRVGSYLI